MEDSNPKRSYKRKSFKKAEVSPPVEQVEVAPEIDHSKEEVLVNVGDMTKCGCKVNAIVDDKRVLISDKSGAKVVNKSDIEIV